MADAIGAAVLALVALALLVWGIRRELRSAGKSSGESSVSSRPLVTYDVADDDGDWTDSDRYHGSRQWGR